MSLAFPWHAPKLEDHGAWRLKLGGFSSRTDNSASSNTLCNPAEIQPFICSMGTTQDSLSRSKQSAWDTQLKLPATSAAHHIFWIVLIFDTPQPLEIPSIDLLQGGIENRVIPIKTQRTEILTLCLSQIRQLLSTLLDRFKYLVVRSIEWPRPINVCREQKSASGRVRRRIFGTLGECRGKEGFNTVYEGPVGVSADFVTPKPGFVSDCTQEALRVIHDRNSVE